MRRRVIMPAAAVAAAGLVLVAGIALAKSNALLVAHNATVKDQSGATRQESIVVNGRGFAVYELTGDSARHPECTGQCQRFWPPVTVRRRAKPGAQSGIHGRLATWKHGGMIQLTLSGHPLYTYSGDQSKHMATGEGIMSFGGTWHVVTPSGSAGSSTTTTGSTTTSSVSGTSTTTTSMGTSYSTTSSSTTATTPVCTNPPYCY